MGALFKNPKHLAFRISHPNQETGGGKVKLRLGHSSMRALLLLSLALCASPARSARLRVQFRPQRASPAASGASNASFAALGACPAQISLVSGCVDASTLSEAGACVIGPDGEASNSSSIVEICGGGVMVDEVDGAVNASGRGIETVDEVGSSWTALDLSSNSLTGFDANATNATLLSLDLSSNSISNISAVSIPTSLTHLNISLNKLSSLALSDDFEYLESLNCSSASLETIDVRATYLKELVVRHNMFTSIGSVLLASTIQVLDLAYNDLADWSDFSAPRDLRTLNASHNGVDKLFSLNLSETDITAIDFSSNNIEEISGIVLPSKLTTLDLRNNSIKSIVLSESDYALLSSTATFYADDLSSTKCSNDKAEAKTLADSISVCVLSDVEFSAVYFGGNQAAAQQSSAGVDTEDEESNETHVVALSVGVSGLIAVWMIVMLVVHARHKKKHALEDTAEVDTATSSNRVTLQPLTQTEIANDVRMDSELASSRIDDKDIMQVRTLAHGSFAVTHLVHFGDKMAVMKQLIVRRDASHHGRLVAFMDEIRICAKLDHKNITEFYGLLWTGIDDLAVVVEYAPRGNLETFLREQKPLLRSSKQSTTWFEDSSTAPAKIGLALQVSEALVYLHSFSPAIFHQNLRAKHVLLGSNWEVKLTGIGYGAAASNSEVWAAPEVLRGGEFTIQADVYAFGVLLSELDLSKRPVSRRSSRSQSIDSASSIDLDKPKFRDDCPSEIFKIASGCLDIDPSKRPTSMELHYSLKQLQRSA